MRTSQTQYVKFIHHAQFSEREQYVMRKENEKATPTLSQINIQKNTKIMTNMHMEVFTISTTYLLTLVALLHGTSVVNSAIVLRNRMIIT